MADIVKEPSDTLKIELALIAGDDILEISNQLQIPLQFVSFVAENLVRIGKLEGQNQVAEKTSCNICSSASEIKCAGCVFFRPKKTIDA